MVGPTAFEVARRYTDDVVYVDEKMIALAMLRLLENERSVGGRWTCPSTGTRTWWCSCVGGTLTSPCWAGSSTGASPRTVASSASSPPSPTDRAASPGSPR
ncbi:hypothetical protein Naga_102791g1 [Nannochloropsis gaditana]|uniref:Uncharacterized protein n=1 Tax=Nannochloropsis gaditana TaxID=72520 RepID=W7THJ1_9STRA|nr:hypothetical protein Naga_102791g1 [Nannochloropsis gaditana]